MSFVVGDYRAIALIGTGASARVWSGVAVSTGAPVALKVFRADRLPMARREAALAAAVDHPHVLRVLDVVGDGERAVLVTELASGGDLAALLERRGRLSPGETLTVLLPLAAALATAHERQIVHGDLSAENVLFDRAGRPLLADLGAGRAAAESDGPVAVTPTDAAPELARGGAPCAATDMFSLGSLALACLTGRHAWPADDLRDVLIQAAAGQWPDPADADGPPVLVSAIRSLLEHDADRRPAAASLVMDLRAAGRPEPLDLRLGGPKTDPTGLRDRPPGALIIGREQGSGAPTARSGGPDAPGPSAPVGGRHGRPADPPGGSTRTAAPEHRLDLGRIGRARAVTRVRPDTPPPPVPTPPSRLQRVRAFTRPGTAVPARRSGPARPGAGRAARRRAVRIAALALITLAVAGLAGAGGLWWARWDRTDPVALDRAGSSGSASAAAVGSSSPTSPSPTSSPSAAASVPRTVSTVPPATPTAPTVSTSTRPRPATINSSRPGSTAQQTSSRSVGGRSPSSPAKNRADFTKTVQELDDARARALVNRDAALLDAVYTSDSAARSVDAGMIASLISGGLRLSGAQHVVRSARVVGAAPLRIEVDDSLPSYQVLDAAGSIVGSTAPRAVSARVMVLVNTPAGYRISAVQPG